MSEEKQIDDIKKMIDDFTSKHAGFKLTADVPIDQLIEQCRSIEKNASTHTDWADVMRYQLYIREQLEKQATAQEVLNWPSIECPFFTDKEIEDLKGYYSDTAFEESYHDYFDESALTMKHGENYHHKSYSSRVMELQTRMHNTIDPKEIDEIKQNLISIGWNPEIEYNPTTQLEARNRFINTMGQLPINVELVDISTMLESLDEAKIVTEAAKQDIYPVSIVLVRGDSIISGPISDITNSEYTHSSLALDGDYTRLYSYNMDNKFNPKGGFSLESVKNYPKDNSLMIYTFFVSKDDYDKLNDKLQYLLYNIHKTKYDILNLILFPFRNLGFNHKDSMICSQFVDSCMKLIDIDITGEKSHKVSPGLLYKSAAGHTKVYKTYEGKVKDFDHARIKKYLQVLSRHAKLIKESVTINIMEVRRLPIEINSNGDVLLTNPIPDFDAEYAASHKLLVEYDKAGNIEAMKYELARLYFMNYILERKLYHNRFLKNKEKNMKTRARVLNDFNKYIKIILKAQPNFNFSEYYETSPFYHHTIEVKRSTIKGIKDILSYIS